MSLERRASVYAALGEAARLAVVDALVMGDRAPGELGEALGMSSNLLAHHLRVLEEAGLVRRTRSEADQRRAYVRLIPEGLAALAPAGPGGSLHVPRVVFVCTRNSARSQLATTLWRRRSGVPAASAGTDPAPRAHPRAVGTARRHGLALDGTRTAHVRDVLQPDDLIVAVCDNAYEQLERRPQLHWSVPDPVRADTDQAFEDAFTEIQDRVQRLAQAVDPAPEHSQ